mmetsp:Transcript_41924/g.90011  ORF Transcript_41924/g.90011 Transcript_41924/m.90011 type:complete len:196 (-) Transcript_41924:282-869(-)
MQLLRCMHASIQACEFASFLPSCVNLNFFDGLLLPARRFQANVPRNRGSRFPEKTSEFREIDELCWVSFVVIRTVRDGEEEDKVEGRASAEVSAGMGSSELASKRAAAPPAIFFTELGENKSNAAHEEAAPKQSLGEPDGAARCSRPYHLVICNRDQFESSQSSELCRGSQLVNLACWGLDQLELLACVVGIDDG